MKKLLNWIVRNLDDTKTARWLAWFIIGSYISLMGIGIALMILTGSALAGASFALLYVESAVLTIWVSVGVLIVSRHPRHPVGWLWCLLPFFAAVDNLAWGYAYYGTITNPGSLPGIKIMILWLYLLLGRSTVGPFGMMFIFLVFPTGRFLSRRWAIVAWVAVVAVAIYIPAATLAGNPVGYFPFSKDLFALSGSARAVFSAASFISSIVLLLCVLAAFISLFLRLARSTGEERQQLKWFVYSTSVFPIGFLLTTLPTGPQPSIMAGPFYIGALLVLVGVAGMSVASAIAIYRYRLWDIDIIIRKTLVYGALTLTLAVVYISSVVLFQELFQAITGQDRSPIATVISTLAIAALFIPLRRRIQNDIDRRFYRQKYDAHRIAEEFAIRARDEVELDVISEHLLDSVEKTLQPEHVSLWLRKAK